MWARWTASVFCWRNFFGFLAQEIKVFLYFAALLSVLRVVFIGWMHDYIGSGVIWGDVWTALLYGFRLSLKSAGILALCSATVGLCAYLLRARRAGAIRLACNFVFILVLMLLFCARIPYYEQFHSGFNQLIFNTFNDDVYALAVSLVEEHHLVAWLFAAFAASWGFYRLLVRWLRLPVPEVGTFRNRFAAYAARGAILLLLYQAVVFVRFGGATDFAGNIDWENAGVTKDQLLNEAILDDLQALYRADDLNGRLVSSTGLAFEPSEIGQYAAALTGRDLQSDDLDDYLRKTALGAPGEKPSHIFLIVSESYANWPLLEAYRPLGLADGLRAIAEGPDGAYSGRILPNGMSTISGVMGIVTGLADANLYLTTMPEAYAEPYATAIAPQLRRLGYRANFWYAGPASWENIRDFTLAQGFERFYGRGDYGDAVEGSVWGCDDAALYRAVMAGVSEEPSFNVVLNVSNHSPFTIDLDNAGFDDAAIKAKLPPEAASDASLVRQLGHFWYADRSLAAFVNAARQKYPDSLFMIVGDHADRVNIDKTPTKYERYAVPLVVSGPGVASRAFAPDAAGSHIDVGPTLLELVAPRGFSYVSLGNSLTRGNRVGANYGFWITGQAIGATDGPFAPEIAPGGHAPNAAAVERYVEAVRAVSWWRAKYGNRLARE